MEMLSLGSIVKLQHGTQPIMVISRGPLFNNHGTIGYFEYGACLYPDGYAGGDLLFFNHEDIEEVLFEGFVDEREEEFRKLYEAQVTKATVKKLYLEYEKLEES